MVATAEKTDPKRKTNKGHDEAAAFQRQLAAMRLAPDAPNRDVARSVIEEGEPPAPAPQPEPAADPEPAPKPARKPKRSAATERVTVTLTPDELDQLDRMKATMKRRGVKIRNLPDAWAFRIALQTWQPGDHDLAALAAEIRAADGRTRD